MVAGVPNKDFFLASGMPPPHTRCPQDEGLVPRSSHCSHGVGMQAPLLSPQSLWSFSSFIRNINWQPRAFSHFTKTSSMNEKTKLNKNKNWLRRNRDNVGNKKELKKKKNPQIPLFLREIWENITSINQEQEVMKRRDHQWTRNSSQKLKKYNYQRNTFGGESGKWREDTLPKHTERKKEKEN